GLERARGCDGSRQDRGLGDGGGRKQLRRAVAADGSEIPSEGLPGGFPRLDRRQRFTIGHADGLASLTGEHPRDQRFPPHEVTLSNVRIPRDQIAVFKPYTSAKEALSTSTGR